MEAEKMQINMKAWLYGLINSSERKALPLLSYPGAALKGFKIIDVVKKAQLQAECIKAIATSYPTEAAVTCMDLSVEAEAFGCEIGFKENEVPTVTRGVITDLETVAGLTVPKLGSGRTMEYLKAAEITAGSVKGCPTLAGMIGPFSLAGRLFNMTEIMMAVLTEPGLAQVLVDKCTQFLVEYAQAYKNAGANGIIIAEPAAGLLSPPLCQQFSSVYLQKIVAAVQDDYFMVILHNCGNTVNLVDSMLTTGCMGYHFGNAVDLLKILPQIPWGRIAFGNIDPAGVLKHGSADEVKAKTAALLEQTAIYKNFVLSTGCDVPPGTPESNIAAFFEALDGFNSSIMIGATA
jgi:uroporphyrinogen decarboxylase